MRTAKDAKRADLLSYLESYISRIRSEIDDAPDEDVFENLFVIQRYPSLLAQISDHFHEIEVTCN